MQEILRKSAMEQFSAIKNKEVSAVELTQATLDRIHSIDDKLGSFNSLTEDRALETAKYIALENNTIINVDDRFNERKIGNMGDMEWKEFFRLQMKDFNFKLLGGESLAQTKKRMVDAMKNILMFETGNRVALVSHSTALTCLLSAWCEVGHNYDDEIILSYGEETIVDGHWTAPMVYKVVFDGMNVLSIDYINIEE